MYIANVVDSRRRCLSRGSDSSGALIIRIGFWVIIVQLQ